MAAGQNEPMEKMQQRLEVLKLNEDMHKRRLAEMATQVKECNMKDTFDGEVATRLATIDNVLNNMERRMDIVVHGSRARLTEIEERSRNKFGELERHIQIIYVLMVLVYIITYRERCIACCHQQLSYLQKEYLRT